MKVYGSGHVVAYNAIANFHDGVDMATYGNPDGTPNPIRDRMPVSIDFYGNDIFNMEDNCIESDGGAHNIRIFRNRCFNHGHRALSVQPMFGGPVYFIRNIVYHAPEGGAVKFTASSAGIVVYHNTLIAPVKPMLLAASNVHYRNNLDPGKERDARDLRRRDQHQLFELGLQRVPSERRRGVFLRVEHAADERCAPTFRASPGSARRKQQTQFEMKARERRRFKTLKEYSDATGQDKHSVLVDYDVFVQVTRPVPIRERCTGLLISTSTSTRFGRGRYRRAVAWNQRRFHRPRPGPGRAMRWVGRFRITAPGNKPRIERI